MNRKMTQLTQLTNYSKSPHAYRPRPYGTREKSIHNPSNSSNPSIRVKNQTNNSELMKAMTRQELADKAGVTTKTLSNWLTPHEKVLSSMGMKPRHILPPKVVAWLVERYSIDVDD